MGMGIGAMFWFRLVMIHIDPMRISPTIKTPKASASTLLDVVRSGGDVEEEDEVDADLSDRQHHQRNRNARPPHKRRPDDEERHRGDQGREAQADKVANDAFRDLVTVARLVAGRMVGRRGAAASRRSSSCACPEEIDHCEDRDPDDVERVPEEGEAENATQDVGAIALGEHLRHHRQQPHEPEGDVHAVAADQGEEGGEEGAALRTRALAIMPTNS